MTSKIKDKPKEKAVDMGAPAKNVNDKPLNKGKDVPTLDQLLGWLEYSRQTWNTKKWDYFVIDQFVRGNHNITGNPVDNSIEVTQTSDYISYPINKMYSNFRAVRGFVTKHYPKVEVTPTEFEDSAKEYARRSTAVLERDNRLNDFHRINKEWVYYGIKYGVGYRQVGYDIKNQVSQRWSIDPFDLDIVAATGKFEDAPAIIKSIVRTVNYWNKKYPKAGVTADNEPASHEYKKLSMEIEMGGTSEAPQRSEEQTAVGYECWYRVYEKNKAGGFINKVLFTKNQIIDFTETPFDEYPFVAYESDIIPNEPYPEGHMKHQIAPQRMLDLLNMQLLDYNYIVNKGRFQFAKGSGFEIINAKEGQLIRHNPGKPVQVVPPPPISPLLLNQLQYADDVLDIMGAQSDASRGQAPFAGASGDLVEALQSADTSQLSELRENFEDALAREAKLILKMYNIFEKKGFVVEDEVRGKEIDRFAVVGKKATEGMMMGEQFYAEDDTSLNYFEVVEDNHVKVTIGSELGETKQARLALMLRLVSVGMPLKYLLEYLEFPDVDGVMQRIAEETLGELQANKISGQQQGQPKQGQVASPLIPRNGQQ